MTMPIRPGDFEPVLRDPTQYCDLAKELICAAEVLDQDAGRNARGRRKRSLVDPHLSASLADWFEHKAKVLDQQYQIWEHEEQTRNSQIEQMGGARAVIEKEFSHALTVAREVVIFHEKQSHEPDVPSFKDKIHTFFFGPESRRSKSDS